jgi:hypothetical protein
MCASAQLDGAAIGSFADIFNKIRPLAEFRFCPIGFRIRLAGDRARHAWAAALPTMTNNSSAIAEKQRAKSPTPG